MSDRRLTPTNGRVAHVSLAGRIEAERFVAGVPARIGVPVADLLSRPGARERQLLYGEDFLILDREGLFVFGQSGRDGYVGWLPESALAAPAEATHWVSAPATHAYPAASIKGREMALLSLCSRLTVVGEAGSFVVTDAGWHVPRQHVSPLDQRPGDPVAVAESLLGTPYLWGGNSRSGIDCSGLVQISCLACAIPCPGDSDLQRGLGRALADTEPLRRGDLLFWPGHVAWVADEARILHANAHSMSVAYEGTDAAIARIAAAESPLIARRRL